MYLTDQCVHINSSSYTSVNLVNFKLYLLLGSDYDDKDISQRQQTHDQQHSDNKLLPLLGC